MMANNVLTKFILLTIFLLTIALLIMGSVPPTSRDALTHHLAVPKLWIENGALCEIPNLMVSYYPMNIDLLYVIPMYFGNDIVPKFIHFFFGMATAWLIYHHLKQRTNLIFSVLGVLLFLSIPVIVKLSINVYVDLGLVFFSWAAINQLFAWARFSQSPKHLIFSSILCGIALGTKYNGMIILLLLTFSVPIIYIRTAVKKHFNAARGIGFSILFFLIAMIVFSPWMIRNFHLTGNPIYPLYNNSIRNKTDKLEVYSMSMKPWLQRKIIYQESALEISLVPIRIFFQGKDDNPRFFDGRLNPILFMCPLLLLVKRRQSDSHLKLEQWFLAAFSVLYLLYTSFMVDMRIRYIAPIIPPLVVLTVYGIQEAIGWIDTIPRKKIAALGRWVVAGAVFFFIFINAQYVVALFKSVDPLPYVMGRISREEYLESKLPDYSAIQFVNHIPNNDMRVLALFVGNRLYYFDKPVEFGTQSLVRMISDSGIERTLASQLSEKRFTHFVIGVKLFEAWANQSFDERQKKLVSHWLKDDCKLLFSKNGYAVLELIQGDTRRFSTHQKGNIE